MSMFPLIGGDEDDDDAQSLQRLVWGSGLKVVNPSGKWSCSMSIPQVPIHIYYLITTDCPL